MIIRDFDPGSAADARAVDLLIHDNHGHNVRIADDYIMVSDTGVRSQSGDPILNGLIVARPVMYMHELIVSDPSSALKRIIAEGLVAHALSKGAMIGERYAHFTVAPSNRDMQRFIEGHDAIRQPDGVLYELSIPTAYYRGGFPNEQRKR